MEIHRQIGVYRDVMKYNMSTNKLQDVAQRLEKQLKNEKSSNKEKQLKIIDLEQQIVKLVQNPSDMALVQAMLKEKDKEISSLKKKLNIPTVEHSQTVEVLAIQYELEKDMIGSQALKDKITTLENELNKLKKQNQDILLQKDTALQSSSSENPTEKLAQAVLEMSLKDSQLNQAHDQLKSKYDELSSMSEKLPKRDLVISELQ